MYQARCVFIQDNFMNAIKSQVTFCMTRPNMAKERKARMVTPPVFSINLVRKLFSAALHSGELVASWCELIQLVEVGALGPIHGFVHSLME